MRLRTASPTSLRVLLACLVSTAGLALALPSSAASPTGWSLASSIDGGTSALGSAIATTDSVAVVGAPFAPVTSGGAPAGAVLVYTYAGGTWTSQRLVAPTPIDGGNFGTSVAASGSLVAVGAPGTPPAAYVFVADAGGYESQKSWADPKGDSNQSFAGSIAVLQGTNGTNYVAVAAPPGSSSAQGTVYVSRQVDGGAWSDPPTAITDPSAQSFAIAVAFTDDGALLVGDPATGSGQVLVYRASAAGVWTNVGTLPVSFDGGTVSEFGNGVAAGDGRVVVTAPGTGGGVAFVFSSSDAGVWTQEAVLAGSSAESFGNFIPAVSGGLVAVGSAAINSATSGAGQVDVWAESGGTWVAVPSAALAGDAYYGQAVGVVGSTLFVGDTSAAGASSIADVTSSLFIETATYADGGAPTDAAAGGVDGSSAGDASLPRADASTTGEGGPGGEADGGGPSSSGGHGGCSCTSSTGDGVRGWLGVAALGAMALVGGARRRTRA